MRRGGKSNASTDMIASLIILVLVGLACIEVRWFLAQRLSAREIVRRNDELAWWAWECEILAAAKGKLLRDGHDEDEERVGAALDVAKLRYRREVEGTYRKSV